MKTKYKLRGLMSLIGLILLLPAQARYVQVTSLEEITSGAQYLITSEPSLESGYIMGNMLTNMDDKQGKLKSIELPTDESKYKTWEIVANSGSTGAVDYYYTIRRNTNILGILDIDGTDLKVGNNDKWQIKESDDIPASFLIQNVLTPERTLSMTETSDKYWGNYSGSKSVYLFKQVTVPAPEFSLVAQQFYEAIQVELTVADGYTIHYTTDGSTPTVNSTEYSGPIEISGATTTVKAIAVEADGTTSEVVEQTYTYCPPIVVNLGGEDHLGTLYSAYPVQLPANAAAWLITGKDDATATLQLQCYADEAGTVLPAEVPYLIQGTSNDEPLNFILSTPPPVEKPDYADDLFKGTAERVTPPVNAHILGLGYNKNETAFGFYPFVGEYIAANRAYLTLPKGATYRLITSMEDFVSGAQYILVTENNDGQPAGYYAGAFDDNRLPLYPLTEKEPYLWMFTLNTDKTVSFMGENDVYYVGYKIGDSGLYQNSNSISVDWHISFNESGNCLLGGTDERYIQQQENSTYFRYYQLSVGISPYLFLREEVDASSQAAGYALRLERPVGIGGARGAEAPGAGAVYDLRGRRLEGRPARGLYIEAGAVRLAR